MQSHVLLYTIECAECFPGFEEFGQHRASLDTTGQCFLLGWAAHFFSFFTRVIAKWTVAGAGWRPIHFSFFHVCGSIIFPFPGLTFQPTFMQLPKLSDSMFLSQIIIFRSLCSHFLCLTFQRPMNGFMLFAKKFRLELIQQHPGKDNR